MEKNKNYRKKAGIVSGVILIALMLTLGVSMAQHQNASVVKTVVQETPCYECGTSFEGDDDEICLSIGSILNQIIQGYESGNPCGWSLLFPGYGSGGVVISEATQSGTQGGQVLFSMPFINPSSDISIKKETGIVDIGTTQTQQPYISEYEIYLRAVDVMDFCINGDALGDWIDEILGGHFGDGQAYLLAVLQCFKIGACAISVITVPILNIILASVTLTIFSIVTVAQILVAGLGMLMSAALQIAQQLYGIWRACVDFYYTIYGG